MLKKKTKAVPHAEELTPTKETIEPQKPEKQPEKAPEPPKPVESEPPKPPVPPEQSQPPPLGGVSIADLVKNLDENKLKMAEGLGIPLRGILQWAYTLEKSVMAQGQAIESLGVHLKPLVDAIQERQKQAQAQPSQQANGGPLAGLPVQELISTGLKHVLGGGSSQGDEFYNLFKEQVIKSGLASMTSDQEIGRAVKQRVVSELSGKIITGVMTKPPEGA